MVEVASIVIAVLSFAGTLLIGAAGIVYTWSSDERKRRTETENLVAKYHDPLLIAAQDLRSRLYGLLDLGLSEFHRGNPDEQDNLRMYTTFLVGQYLSWTYILRRQAQFLKFSTNKKNNHLTKILAQITDCFATGSLKGKADDAPFRLWRAQQIAIGELMTIHEGPELYCMGYTAFRKAYHTSAVKEKGSFGSSGNVDTQPTQQVPFDSPLPTANTNFEDRNPDFKSWFQPIIEGAETVARARCAHFDALQAGDHGLAGVPDKKIRRLQHLLHDLELTLDPELSAADPHSRDRCHRVENCACSTCKSNNICPSPHNGKIPCAFVHRGTLVGQHSPGVREKLSESKRMPV